MSLIKSLFKKSLSSDKKEEQAKKDAVEENKTQEIKSKEEPALIAEAETPPLIENTTPADIPAPLSKPSQKSARVKSGAKLPFAPAQGLHSALVHPMTQIIENTKNPPEEGNLVDGPVIEIDKSKLFIDLAPFGTGIIYGREFSNASDIIKKINVGDTITAKVVERENEDGYVELSLKEARQALIWKDAEEMIQNKTSLELAVKEANKGGLIIEWQGIPGFLPASQLKAEHYPRVLDGDKEKILQ